MYHMSGTSVHVANAPHQLMRLYRPTAHALNTVFAQFTLDIRSILRVMATATPRTLSCSTSRLQDAASSFGRNTTVAARDFAKKSYRPTKISAKSCKLSVAPSLPILSPSPSPLLSLHNTQTPPCQCINDTSHNADADVEYTIGRQCC